MRYVRKLIVKRTIQTILQIYMGQMNGKGQIIRVWSYGGKVTDKGRTNVRS